MRNIEGLFKRQQQFRDFDIRFKVHPITKDLVTKDDIESIKQSVVLLVMTEFYERPYQPKIGTRIASALFESFDSDIVAILPDEIKRFLTRYEPRIEVKRVSVGSAEDIDSNSLRVEIAYLIVGSNTRIEQEIILKRVR